MPWAKVDDGLHTSEKFAAVSLAATGLWTLCLSWTTDKLKDGLVPFAIVRRLGGDDGETLASELVEAGLWEQVEAGWYFHDYLDYNPPAEKIIAEREAAKERMTKRRSGEVREVFGRSSGEQQAKFGPRSPSPDPDPDPVIPTVLVTPLIPQGGAVAVEAVVMPMSNEGGTEADTDAFTPAELLSEPLPAPASRRQQASEKQRTDEKRTAIMQAYRAVRFDRPLTDSIPEAEFNRMKGHADSLIAMGVGPEQVRAATDEALNRTEAKYVTLGYLAGHWTEITTPLPAPRPSAIAGPVRLTAAEQRDARQKADRDAEYEQLARIERELFGDGVKPPVPLEPSGPRVLVSDDAFARPPRRTLGSASAGRVVQ